MIRWSGNIDGKYGIGKICSFDIPKRMKYMKFSKNNVCNGVVISDRAYKQLLCQTFAVCEGSAVYGVETGGVLLGHFIDGLWYIVESVDQGMKTVNQRDLFSFDNDYVNHNKEYLSKIYKYPLTILGIWHRHPGSMDTFSLTDEDTMRKNAEDSRCGILSMLVNIDPNFRMTFYHCNKEDVLMKLPYVVGDEYFIKDLIEYRSIRDILANDGGGVGLIFPEMPSSEAFIHSLAERDAMEKRDLGSDGADKEETSSEAENVASDGTLNSDEAIDKMQTENDVRLQIARLFKELVSSSDDTDEENCPNIADKIIKLTELTLYEIMKKEENNNG